MSMVRFLFLGLVAALTVACDTAPKYSVPKTQAPALWMVEDEKGKRGYIMGSVHMLPDGLEWVTPKIQATAAASDILITEIGGQAAPDGLFTNMGSDEPVSPLDRRLDKDDFIRAEILMSGAGLSEADVDSTESWAVALLLTRAQAADLGIATDYGVETRLRREVMAGKPVIGLENAEAQYRRFDALPDAAQASMLRLSIKPVDARADFQAMLTAWLSGTVEALAAQTSRGIMADPALRVALLDTPNGQWAKAIAGHIRAGKRPFIAIGAAHLLDDGGVLKALERDGFTVTRVQ